MNDQFNEKSPREVWEKWRKTKYSDADIRAAINSARHSSGTDYSNEPYAQSAAQIALAMIEYNRMIDERIGRAQNTWRSM